MKGIEFIAENLEKIIARKKVQTRRSVSEKMWLKLYQCLAPNQEPDNELIIFSPYKVGETIFIRESYWLDKKYNKFTPSQAIEMGAVPYYEKSAITGRKRHKRYMPEAFARTFIKMQEIRIERVQAISDTDCIAEGIEATVLNGHSCYPIFITIEEAISQNIVCFETENKVLTDSLKVSYGTLFDKINGLGSFKSNPHVFTYIFKLI